MNLRRSISWGLVVLLLIFAAQFVWHETTREEADRDFIRETPEAEEEAAVPDTSSGEERPGVADAETAPDEDVPGVSEIEAPPAAPDEGPAAGADTPDGANEEPVAGADTPGATEEAAAPATLDEEAAEYVAGLAKPKPEPVPGESADHFVGADQEIRFGPALGNTPPGPGEELAIAETPEDPLRSGITGQDVATPDPAAEVTTPEQAEAATGDEETPGKPAREDTAELTPADQATAAGENETPTAPTEKAARKPVENNAAEPAPDATETGTASGKAPVVASGELLKQADDDISDLVADPGTVAAREDEPATPSEETSEKAETRADDETAPEAKPAPAAGDEAPARPARTANKATEGTAGRAVSKAANGTAEPAAVTGRATTGESEADEVATPARTPAVRGTPRTTAPQGATTIRELLEGTVEVGDHDVFYVHAVTPEDRQGVWGIIQKAVTENFARGVRLTIEGRTDTYRIAVHPQADEILDDRSSSPLGLVIHRKSGETIVYNRELGRLTLDPDVTIYPGNELVIVGFKPEELIELFKHFAGTDGR